MKVSVITSVYNNEKHIENALKSVFKQTYKDIEYIVVDGASQDSTTEIIKKYRNKISKFISEPDNGIYDGLNKGVINSSGDIIGFLHSDDEYYDEKTIEKIVAVFEKYPETAGVYGDLVYINEKGGVVRYWKSGGFNVEKLKKGWMPPHPALFLRREIYEKYGLFDTSFKISADYDFILRFLKDAPEMRYIPEVIYKMRTGGVSNRIANSAKKVSEDISALRKNGFGLFTVLYKNISKIPQFFIKS